jgi:serine/threonine-protein kinase
MYPQVFGKYVLERELARGGMARVLLATLRGAGGFEKKLVVKQIRDELASDEEFVKRFVEEAKTTVALAHPNIVPVYELGVELGTYFLAMELVEGASVAELLRASPTGLTPEEGAYVGVEVCRALDYAHRRVNVVHRDVTPRNVMVDYEGLVKVIDFGISAPVATAPTGEGVFGSPGHMPPEQMEGKQLTPAADVFAVGVLLMELWSGRAPFRRRSKEEIEAALRAPHPTPSAIDIRLLPLDEVMSRALALEPHARPQQADDLARALRRFLAGVDLGDVARQLGERVRAVREHPPPPSTEHKPVLQRPPSRPTATQVGTKTFAARSEVGQWDGRHPAKPESMVVATRRLASNAPPADEETPSAQGDGPADAREGTNARARVREVDTVATRPIETGPETGRSARPPRRRGIAWALGGAAALAVGAFFLGRGSGATGVLGVTGSSGAPTSTAVTATVPGSALATVSASPPAVPGTPGGSARDAESAHMTASAQPVPTTTPASPTEPSAAASQHASLTLLGDGTMVSVDGSSRRPAPVTVSLEPGAHSVVFTFPATGESKPASVSLRAGERATMRADFTGASPTVRVQR